MATQTNFNRGQANRNRSNTSVIEAIENAMGRSPNGKTPAGKVGQNGGASRESYVRELVELSGRPATEFAQMDMWSLYQGIKEATAARLRAWSRIVRASTPLGITLKRMTALTVVAAEAEATRYELAVSARRLAEQIGGGETGASPAWTRDQLEREVAALRDALDAQRRAHADARHPERRPTVSRPATVRVRDTAPRLPRETSAKPVEIAEAESRASKLATDEARKAKKVEIKEDGDRLGRRHRRNTRDGRFVRKDATVEELEAATLVPSAAVERQMTRRGSSARRRAQANGMKQRVALAPLSANVRLHERTVTPAYWGWPTLKASVRRMVEYRHGREYVQALREEYALAISAVKELTAPPSVAAAV